MSDTAERGGQPDAEAASAETRATGDLALVMGGGGARAAYQVGFLQCMSRYFPDLHVPVITGVSAGAINAAHLAAHHGTFRQAVAELVSLWSHLRVQDVFRVGAGSLGWNAVKWGVQLASGGIFGGPRIRGLVDTQPLREFLTEALHAVTGEITGVAYNLERGRLKALAISTSSYSTGQSVTWVQGRDIAEWERPQRRSIKTVMTVEHVMASAALPIFFPSVRIKNAWYGDGGIRLTNPLSPALHLGARRVLAISTRYGRSTEEADQPIIDGYPPPAQVLGVLLNSIFLDLLDQDAYRLDRLNRLLERLPPGQRDGLKPIELLVLRPSMDLGKLANEYEPELPRAFRFLTRGLGTKETRSPDALSLVLFQPNYLQRLIDAGAADAEARAPEIEAFIRGDGA